MGKIGRNEKCPCGSEKKYKNCCLGKAQKEPVQNLVDVSSLLHWRAYALGLIHINTNFKKIFEEFCAINHYDKFNVTISDGFFKQFLDYVESQITNICSKYSSYEMLYWYRRIKPRNIIPWFQESTAHKYHELVWLCIINFGNRIDNFITEDDERLGLVHAYPNYIEPFVKGTSRIDIDVPPDEVVKILNSIYESEMFCAYFIELKNKYRVFNKGGKFVYNQDIGFSVIPENDEIDYLIKLYDKRSKKQSLLSKVGAVSVDTLNPVKQHQLLIVGLQHNFSDKEIDFPQLSFREGSFNFIPFVMDISNYYDYIKQFNETYIQVLGFTSEVFLSVLFTYSFTLYSLIQEVYSNSEDSSILVQLTNLLQRGYELLTNDEEMRTTQITQVMNSYDQLFSEVKKEDHYQPFKKAIDYLFSSIASYDDLENELLRSSLFTQITKRKIVIDYTSFVGVLEGFLDPIKALDGKYGNLCSKNLEDVANTFIVEKFGKENIFVRGVITTISGKMKEIDASLIIEDYLFIFECKSLSVSNGSILGVKNSVVFRTNKIKEYLVEVEKKAVFLVNYRNELSISIPKKIKYIVPIVITSFPEYIWSKEENLFITSCLPRVMVVQEIELLKEAVKHKAFTNKPYLKKL